MGVTGRRLDRLGIGGRRHTMAGTGPTDLLYGSRGLPAAYRQPVSLDPHEACPSGPESPLTRPSGNRRLKPEKKEHIWKEELLPTWRTFSPFVKEHAENDVTSEYPQKSRTRS